MKTRVKDDSRFILIQNKSIQKGIYENAENLLNVAKNLEEKHDFLISLGGDDQFAESHYLTNLIYFCLNRN